jgi:TetR/AcrR family transcriptional regulator
VLGAPKWRRNRKLLDKGKRGYYISKYLLMRNHPVGRPQRTKVRLSGEERRRQILDAALKLFADRGFSGTKTREIAEVAGISETLIFQHFKTKQELYVEALTQLLARHPVIPELEEKARQKDDIGVFATLALHVIKHARQDPRIIRLSVFMALEGPQFGEAFQGGEDSTLLISGFLERYIDQRIADGAFENVNAEIAARLFIDTVFMLSVDREVALTGTPLSFSVEETVGTLVKIFLGGLKA